MAKWTYGKRRSRLERAETLCHQLITVLKEDSHWRDYSEEGGVDPTVVKTQRYILQIVYQELQRLDAAELGFDIAGEEKNRGEE